MGQAMSDKPVVVVRRVNDDGTRYVILWDGRYWHASQWEHDRIIKDDISPEELGMYPFEDEDEN